MMIARWEISAKFGHKTELINTLKKWQAEIGPQIGLDANRTRILSSSVGGSESTVQTEVEIADLAELEAAWAKMATVEAHAEWSKELERYCVSGTNRWVVFRIV